VEKYGTSGQATDENITLCRKDALCMPETKARIQAHTPIIQAHTPIIQAHTPIIQAHTPIIQAHTPIIQAHTPLIFDLILIAFQRQQCYLNAPRCDVTRNLPVLLRRLSSYITYAKQLFISYQLNLTRASAMGIWHLTA
jgi:hypothetical protein